MLSRVRAALREQGLFGTLGRVPFFLYWNYRYQVDHARWDRRWGTETAQTEKSYLEEVDAAMRQDAEFYEPIRWRWFRPMMAHLPDAPSKYAFVDLGSGKGRALFFAARHGFRRVIGVEFSHHLHAVALRNRESFALRERRATTIELHCADASLFEFPEGPLLIFINNPFRGNVMQAVVDRIAQHVARSRAECWVFYKQPLCAEMFDRHPRFIKIVERKGNGRWFMGTEPYVVYRVATSDVIASPIHPSTQTSRHQ